MEGERLIATIEPDGSTKCLGLVNGLDYTINGIERDYRGYVYVSVTSHINGRYHQHFRHYPADLLSPLQQARLRARHGFVTEDCEFLEGRKCIGL